MVNSIRSYSRLNITANKNLTDRYKLGNQILKTIKTANQGNIRNRLKLIVLSDMINFRNLNFKLLPRREYLN